MVPPALLLSLGVRSLTLLLPHTFFQPDEFYQAFEPAHNLVFGFGHLTWEWKDLPVEPGAVDWWSAHVAGGRMRSWIWPGLFALVYKASAMLQLDQTVLLTLLPRVVGITVASLTDYATYRLAAKLLGHGSSAGALFLSLTSLFNAHLLPRALSTSPETLLTVLALLYFPLDGPTVPRQILVGEPPLTASRSMRDLKELDTKAKPREAKAGDSDDVVVYEDVADIDYAAMDRLAPQIRFKDPVGSNLALSVLFASLAICIRPTTIPLWTYLGTDYVFRLSRRSGFVPAFLTAFQALAVVFLTLGASSAIDYAVTGRLVFPALTFVHQNVIRNISAFYGSTDPFYHLAQSLPIMLSPIWYWWAQGFMSCLLPTSLLPRRLSTLDRQNGMKTLSRALTFTIGVLSLSPHSEWRFLHPLLPSLLLFALPAMFRSYIPEIFGAGRFFQSIRQYTRLPRTAYYLCLLAPIVPYLYLNIFHGAAQVEVMNALRRGDLGKVTSLVVLALCHSTPWQSHLHADIDGWFLTCEPPLETNPFDHITSQQMFYAAPVTYLQEVFPSPPVPLHDTIKTQSMIRHPSHIVLFGGLLDQTERTKDGHVSVRRALGDLGYKEIWYMWNGFDLAQDESERRGGVRVWHKDIVA